MESQLEAEMVWSCAEEQWWIYWTKGDKHGAGRQEERRKTTEEDAKYRAISYQVVPDFQLKLNSGMRWTL